MLAVASIRGVSEDKPLPVRIPREMVERIDRLRGLIPRERYVRHLLDRALADEGAPPEPAKSVEPTSGQVRKGGPS